MKRTAAALRGAVEAIEIHIQAQRLTCEMLRAVADALESGELPAVTPMQLVEALRATAFSTREVAAAYDELVIGLVAARQAARGARGFDVS